MTGRSGMFCAAGRLRWWGQVWGGLGSEEAVGRRSESHRATRCVGTTASSSLPGDCSERARCLCRFLPDILARLAQFPGVALVALLPSVAELTPQKTEGGYPSVGGGTKSITPPPTLDCPPNVWRLWRA